MSALTLLGVLGNILSTVAILPHLTQSISERRPLGSASGWALGALCGIVWLVYGVLADDLIIGAPGWVTVPVSLALTIWCWKAQRAATLDGRGVELDFAELERELAAATVREPVAQGVQATVPAPRLGDTLVMPRIGADTGDLPRLVNA